MSLLELERVEIVGQCIVGGILEIWADIYQYGTLAGASIHDSYAPGRECTAIFCAADMLDILGNWVLEDRRLTLRRKSGGEPAVVEAVVDTLPEGQLRRADPGRDGPLEASVGGSFHHRGHNKDNDNNLTSIAPHTASLCAHISVP